MPAVYLTEEQRQQAALQRNYQKISDGLAAYMNRERMTKAQMANVVGVGYKSFMKLLYSEEVNLTFIDLLRTLRIAGYKIVPVKKEEEQ